MQTLSRQTANIGIGKTGKRVIIIEILLPAARNEAREAVFIVGKDSRVRLVEAGVVRGEMQLGRWGE